MIPSADIRRHVPGRIPVGRRMPTGLRAHLRYPVDMFNVQSMCIEPTTCRMPVFYNMVDLWAVTREFYGVASSRLTPTTSS